MTTYQGPLFYEGNGSSPQRQRYSVTHADFTAAAVTEAVSMAVLLPAGARVAHVSHACPTAFSGGSIATAVIDVGINGGNLDQYVDAVDVFTGSTFAYSAAVGDATAEVQLLVATTIDITLTVTADNVVNADAGQYDVDVFYFLGTSDPDDQ